MPIPMSTTCSTRTAGLAGGLQLAREVRDRDAGQSEDRIDAVELERIDDEVKTVGLLELLGSLDGGAGVARLLLQLVFRDRYGGSCGRASADFIHGVLRLRRLQ